MIAGYQNIPKQMLCKKLFKVLSKSFKHKYEGTKKLENYNFASG